MTQILFITLAILQFLIEIFSSQPPHAQNRIHIYSNRTMLFAIEILWSFRSRQFFRSGYFVRQPERGTNTTYLVDFIKICLAAKLLDPHEIRRLYVEEGLSTVQIAKRFHVSRVTIAYRLKSVGVQVQPNFIRSKDPKNYRLRVPPYGYLIRNGALAINKKEIKICRFVVELIERKGLQQNSVARELSKRGFKNRAGKKEWNSKTVFNIYKRWKGKL